MGVQLLISAMSAEPKKLIAKMNVSSDAIILFVKEVLDLAEIMPFCVQIKKSVFFLMMTLCT